MHFSPWRGRRKSPRTGAGFCFVSHANDLLGKKYFHTMRI